MNEKEGAEDPHRKPKAWNVSEGLLSTGKEF
jgi:hypothetical protein